MFELLSRGGPVMIAILFCSIAAVAIILERLFLIRSTKRRMATFSGRVQGLLQYGQFQEAEELCRQEPNPMARIMLAGLDKQGEDDLHVKEAIQAAGEREAQRLEQHMTGLATIVDALESKSRITPVTAV